MKHILITTIAAVLMVGCGEAQQSTPSPEAKPVEPIAEVPVQPSSPPAEAKTPEPVSEDEVKPPKITEEIYEKAFPEISGYYYKKSDLIRREVGNTVYPSYRTAIGIIAISKKSDEKGLRSIFSFSNNSIMAYVEEHKLLTSKYHKTDGAVTFMIFRANLLNENREHIGYWDREWAGNYSSELYSRQLRGNWRNSVKDNFFDLEQKKTGGVEVPQNYREPYREPKYVKKTIKGITYPFIPNAPSALKTFWGKFPPLQK
jgi:hypothetical protein